MGDEVVTIGGIFGTIRELDDDARRPRGRRRRGLHDRPRRDRAGRPARAGRRPTPSSPTTRPRRRRPRATTDRASATSDLPRRHAGPRRRHLRRDARVGQHEPVLGLDLQGGISVVLSPVGQVQAPTPSTSPSTSSATGSTASAPLEPEITRQGSDIVVDLPGVKDRDKAIALVGKTAELRFRPVLARPPPVPPTPAQATTAAATTTTTPRPTTTTTTTPEPRPPTPPKAAVASCDDDRRSPRSASIPTTTRADDKRDACVVLPDEPGSPNAAATTSARPGSPARASTRRQGGVPARATAGRREDGPHRRRAAPSGTPLAAAAVPPAGRDRARRHRAVGARRSSPTTPAFTSFGGTARDLRGEASRRTRPRTSPSSSTTARCPVRLKQVNVENVSPTLGNDQLHAGHHRRHHRPRARRALHARLLPAARAWW